MIKEFQGKYRFLSNFWLCPVVYEGKVYPSSEHAYQAAKFTDNLIRETILFAKTPAKAKMFGCYKFKPREGWDDMKLGVMLEIVRLKFKGNHMLTKWLLETGDEVLQEGNRWHDRFWGVDLATGEGENHLGAILMLVRLELRNETKDTSAKKTE